MKAESNVGVPVYFRGNVVGDFIAVIVVEVVVLLELKAVKEFDTAHESQILNDLRAMRYEVGLIMNLGSKPKFRRFPYANEVKGITITPK